MQKDYTPHSICILQFTYFLFIRFLSQYSNLLTTQKGNTSIYKMKNFAHTCSSNLVKQSVYFVVQ